MSELTLNLIDAGGTLHGRIHGSVADAAIAALSAEPETIPELVAALARYIKPLDKPFAWFRSGQRIDAERWDAGIVIIDLTTRIVAAESSYSQPVHEGQIHYHDGTQATDIPILFRVPDDWLFVNSVEAYQWSLLRRNREPSVKPPLDVREILYGTPLLEFIINECKNITITEAAADEGKRTSVAGEPAPETRDLGEDRLYREVCAIHARWLMTAREDLLGDSPRDVMLAKQDFIDFDLHSRSLQWSLQNEGPPCLSKESFAYRFAGFGTHEWVIYYDLVRYLIWSAIEGKSPTEVGTLNAQLDDGMQFEINRLAEIRSDWLNQPQDDYDGRIPAVLIENERKRLPIALRPRDMIIDEDCPTCQMLGDETSPLGMGVGFWFLDGSQMEEDFAFSSFRTREEWEAENHRRAEFDKEFNRKGEERKQRIARGELEPDPDFDGEPF
ncbi:MAG: hypothetical protein ABI596_16435 [Pyrinomonadaceae bacterium]